MFQLKTMSFEQYKKAADGFYFGAKLVSEYMNKSYHDLLKHIINPPDRDKILLGMYMRAMTWMSTIADLNKPEYFQAIVTGNRALLEIVVDMCLLSYDKTDSSILKMTWWEDSAKYKAAETIVGFYQNIGKVVPGEYQLQLDFVTKNKKEVEKKRLELWPNKKDKLRHPTRWTGHPNLFEDIKIVDKFFGALIKKELGKSLTEFYKTEYNTMNWMIHGSALTGIRDFSIESFHCLCALSYKLCSDLAMLCIKIIFIDYDFITHYPDLKKDWEELRNKRILSFGKACGLVDT
jgi:hypothetical protein